MIVAKSKAQQGIVNMEGVCGVRSSGWCNRSDPHNASASCALQERIASGHLVALHQRRAGDRDCCLAAPVAEADMGPPGSPTALILASTRGEPRHWRGQTWSEVCHRTPAFRRIFKAWRSDVPGGLRMSSILQEQCAEAEPRRSQGIS